MLTRGDDYPIHQTPEPIAYSGTDRNFYDRYFFNGMTADGSIFFAVAFGIYPHLDIMDGAASVTMDGKQYVLRASKRMGGERMVLEVGPLSIEIVEPLRKLRVRIAANESDISGVLEFDARHHPIEEPRFMRRNGTRAIMDYTRMTQNGVWSGKLVVAGKTIDLDPAKVWGTRDRSWGVRPVGTADSQPPPAGGLPQFFWLWTPCNFDKHVVFCHTNDDEHGRPWNRRAVIQGVDGGAAREFEHIDIAIDWRPGSRRVAKVDFTFRDDAGEARLSFLTRTQFYMVGIGYTHPQWGHGMDRGPLAVTHEVIDLATLEDNAPTWIHIQALSDAELTVDGATHKGFGVVEQFMIGPHEKLGLKGFLDPRTPA